jgi:aminoglycoside phosphotransferase family enzyme
MENKKQTAVEWLWEQIDNTIPFQNIQASQIFNGLLEQAKQMERDQIIDAHDAAYIAMNLAFRGFDRSVEYYEKTYGD